METVTITKRSEQYIRRGFDDLRFDFKSVDLAHAPGRVRLAGKAVLGLADALAGFQRPEFVMKWREQAFLGCRVVERDDRSAVVEFTSTEEIEE